MWNAANFGIAYAALIDGVHAASPATRIICQTPIIRTDWEGPEWQVWGETLTDYRTAIANVCNARSPWAVTVDGTKLLAPADIVDGIHPSAAGNAKYADRIAPILAQSSYTVTGPSVGLVSQESAAFAVTLGNSASFLGDQTITISVPDGSLKATAAGGTISNNNTGAVTVTPAATTTGFTLLTRLRQTDLKI